MNNGIALPAMRARVSRRLRSRRPSSPFTAALLYRGRKFTSPIHSPGGLVRYLPGTANPSGGKMPADTAPARPRTRAAAIAGLAVLLVLGAFYVYGAAADLASLARHNLPADHQGTFTKLTGATFSQAKTANPGIASYITTVERGYALHELTFA